MTGYPLSIVCGHGKQDRAALRVAGLLGFEKEGCDMHDGDKAGRSALGDLVRKDGRGQNPFATSNLMSIYFTTCHKQVF